MQSDIIPKVIEKDPYALFSFLIIFHLNNLRLIET